MIVMLWVTFMIIWLLLKFLDPFSFLTLLLPYVIFLLSSVLFFIHEKPTRVVAQLPIPHWMLIVSIVIMLFSGVLPTGIFNAIGFASTLFLGAFFLIYFVIRLARRKTNR